MNKELADGVLVGRNAEIDTRAPFRSVKEAVTLFGEKVLAGELYVNKLKEMNGAGSAGADTHDESSRLDNISVNLEETRQDLKKAREESMIMANWLSSLQDELELTKQELQQWKQREKEKPPMEPEIVDLKFIEGNSTRFAMKSTTSDDEGTRFAMKSSTSDDEETREFQKKRYVTFANSPSETHLIIPQGVRRLERHPSLKKKKKPWISLLGGIFSKKKGIQEIA